MTFQHRPDLAQYVFWVTNLPDDELGHLMQLSLTPYWLWGQADHTAFNGSAATLKAPPFEIKAMTADLMFDAVRLEVLRRWRGLRS